MFKLFSPVHNFSPFLLFPQKNRYDKNHFPFFLRGKEKGISKWETRRTRLLKRCYRLFLPPEWFGPVVQLFTAQSVVGEFQLPTSK
jgi:hypothetical protein